MTKRSRLLKKALNDPGSLSFAEARRLAEQFDFEHARTTGSHHIFKRKGYMGVLNLQDDGGAAKRYQVKQMLDAFRDLGLISEERADP